MSFEADWSFCFVEFGIREGNESKRVLVLIDRLVGVLFNDSRIVVSYKFADSSESAIGEQNWCVRVDSFAGCESIGDGWCPAFCDWVGGVDGTLANYLGSVAW